jgi:hypothetical protein
MRKSTRAFEEAKEARGEVGEMRCGGTSSEKKKQVVKQGLSEYFLFTIEGREDIKDNEPKRLVSMKVADVPLEVIYKLSDRDGGNQFTKYYRFKNQKLLDDDGEEKDLPDMENLGVSPLPDGMVRLFSEYETRTWPTSAARTPSTCPSATGSKSTSADPDITIAGG